VERQGGADHVEIRCLWRKHFEVEPGATGTARVLCRDCRRKRADNALVIHHFDLATGRLLETRVYRDAAELTDRQRRERGDEQRSAHGWRPSTAKSPTGSRN
jgi:hypothetical protein